MRVVFYLLAGINIVLLGWILWHKDQYRPTATSSAPPLSAQTESIRLLSELPPQQIQIAAAPAKPPAASPPPREPERAAAPSQTASGQTPPSQTASNQTAPNQTAPNQTAPNQTAPNQTASNQTAGPAPTPAPADPEPVATPPPATPERRLCQTLGPFSTRARAERFSAALGASAKQMDIRQTQIETPADYWVYLTDLTRDEARAIMRDLEAKGVQDIYLGRQNVISLGLYSDQRTAQARIREIERLGYAPRMDPRMHNENQFWLDIEVVQAEALSPARWTALLADWPNIEREETACK